MWRQLATAGGTFAGNRVAAGSQERLTVVYAPVGPGVFERRETLTTNGIPAATRVTRIRYAEAQAGPTVTAWVAPFENPVALASSTALPPRAEPGDRANAVTGAYVVQDNGMNTSDVGQVRGLSYDWTLTPAGVDRADLCLVITDAAQFVSTARSDCFRIDGSGSILGFRGVHAVHDRGTTTEAIYD